MDGRSFRGSTNRRGQSTSEDVFLTLANDEPREQRPKDPEQRKSRLGFPSPKRFSPSKLLASRRTNSSSAKPREDSLPVSNSGDLRGQQQSRNGQSVMVPSPSSPGEKRHRPPMYNSGIRTSSYNQGGQRSVTTMANESVEDAVGFPFPKRRKVPDENVQNQTPARLPSFRSQLEQLDPAFMTQQSTPADQQRMLNSQMDGSHSPTPSVAPSTVWDELDDLKSRIHNLELSGGRSGLQSTQATQEIDGRPRTAMTMTSMSSYSAARRAVSGHMRSEAIAPSPVRSHQLLLAALGKVENQVPVVQYNALKASAADALDLATMLAEMRDDADMSDHVSTINGEGGSDKRLRRKADNLCRNLTDLCIALCDDDLDGRSVSRFSMHSRYTSQDTARDPSYNPSQSNGNYSPLNYLEQRRLGLDNSQSSHRRLNSAAPQRDDTISLASRQHHARHQSTALPRLTADQFEHNSTPHSPDDQTIRLPSRVIGTNSNTYSNTTANSTTMTESPHDLRQFSRNYTSRYPLPPLAPKYSNVSLGSGRKDGVGSGEQQSPGLVERERSSPGSGEAVLLADRILRRREMQRLGREGEGRRGSGLSFGG